MNKMCVVVNIKNDEYDVLIQRGTKWGNPYGTIHHTRDEAINLYKKHLQNKIKDGKITIDDLKSLRGKRLGCSCKPKRCHGDVLADLVNKTFDDYPFFVLK